MFLNLLILIVGKDFRVCCLGRDVKHCFSVYYEIVFSGLGFDFKKDLKLRDLVFDKNSSLTEHLKNSVFFYNSPNNTNTSFYLITTFLDVKELEEVRRYVWNKNDADLIFYYPNEEAKLVMFYAKYSPKTTYKESVLDTFTTTKKDIDKLDKIKHWQFDSGVFWFNYSKFIDKARYKGIDKELVSTLEALKKQLDKALINLIPKETERNERVQALIDRTLYIKYLEDNHIINSHFYGYYFDDDTLNYEKLLENNSDADLNKLFKKIHEIFNNSLFERPTIDNKYLTKEVRGLIANSFNTNLDTGQLKLFHFQFDILPVEFISYIYEVFLSDKQKENGIYYTPKKLAQLIVDEVINEDKIGSILDPSSGSGMFLIVGYQRLLEIAIRQGLEPNNSIDKIKFRTKLLSENIFGIEKELTAQRFTLFSLSLQIFKGINPDDIKDFIANELKQNKKINLFSQYSFFDNIKHANTLNVSEKRFVDKKFTYIVGNPPFFEVPNSDDYKTEISFLKTFEVDLGNGLNRSAKDIVGKSQISQCFFLKIKDWADDNTRFGFVSNSSNFYNDYSGKFQNYFYSSYGIEKVYELSRVKKILFEKAKESVVALIFTNEYNDNIFDYYPVRLGLFSEIPFELLIIQEDSIVKVEQSKLINGKIGLREYLSGNEYDRELINKINDNSVNLACWALKDNKGKVQINSGFKIWAEDARKKEYSIDRKKWAITSKEEKERLRSNFYLKYFRNEKSDTHFLPYIEYNKLSRYKINGFTSFISDISNFDRPRVGIFEGKKIILSRFGDITAAFSNTDLFFNTDILTIKLKDDNLIFLTLAILNSRLTTYYLYTYLKKRLDGKFSKIGVSDIKQIPVPKEIDADLAKQISNFSAKLSNGQSKFSEVEDEINKLIYDLYELSYWERRRVEDYFLIREKIGKRGTIINNYKTVLLELLSFYVKSPIEIEETTTDFNLKVIKISLNTNANTPKADKTKKYILNEIFEQNPNENFLASQEKIYGKDCVYIIKENINKKWTETKAFEDGQDLIKHLIPSVNGERIH